MSFVESEITAAAGAGNNQQTSHHDQNDQFDFGGAQRNNAFNFSPVMEEIEHLRAHNLSLEEAVQYHQKNTAFQRERISNLERENEGMSKQIAALQAERDFLKERNTTLESTVGKLHGALLDVDLLVKSKPASSGSSASTRTGKSNGGASSTTLKVSPVPAPDHPLADHADEYSANQQWNDELLARRQQEAAELSYQKQQLLEQQRLRTQINQQQPGHADQALRRRPEHTYGRGETDNGNEFVKPQTPFSVPNMLPQHSQQSTPSSGVQRSVFPDNLTSTNQTASASFAASRGSANEILQQLQQQSQPQHYLTQSTQRFQKAATPNQQNQPEQQHLRIGMPPPPPPPPRLTTAQPITAPFVVPSTTQQNGQATNTQQRFKPGARLDLTSVPATPSRPGTTSKWFPPGTASSAASSLQALSYNPSRPASTTPRLSNSSPAAARIHNPLLGQQSPTFNGLKRAAPPPVTPSQGRQFADIGGGVPLMQNTPRATATSLPLSSPSRHGGIAARGVSGRVTTQRSHFDDVTQLLVPQAKRRKPWVPMGGNQ